MRVYVQNDAKIYTKSELYPAKNDKKSKSSKMRVRILTLYSRYIFALHGIIHINAVSEYK